MTAIDVVLAPMQNVDLLAIHEIEKMQHDFPWSLASFASSLSANHLAWVLRHRQQIIAYSVSMQVVDELHLLNLTVAEAYQRKGWGAYLLDQLALWAQTHACGNIILEVRRSNDRALALYHKKGYEQIAVRRAYYRTRTGSEDALLMSKPLLI